MSIDRARMSGVIVATALPFDERLRIDWDSYARLLDYCVTPAGVTAVFVNGHAGEGAALSAEERREVIQATRRQVGTMPILAGVTAQATDEAIRQAAEARDAGADMAVLFPPPSLQGAPLIAPDTVVRYFSDVAAAVDLPLAVFQYPLAGGFGYNTETLVQLAQLPAVRLIKEASGDPVSYEINLRRIRAVAPEVSIMPTNSAWLATQASIGGDGILSGLGSLTPHWLVEAWAAVERADLRALWVARDKLYSITRAIYGTPRLDAHTRIKVALQHLGVIRHALPRGPLQPIPETIAAQVRQAVDDSELPRLAGR